MLWVFPLKGVKNRGWATKKWRETAMAKYSHNVLIIRPLTTDTFDPDRQER